MPGLCKQAGRSIRSSMVVFSQFARRLPPVNSRKINAFRLAQGLPYESRMVNAMKRLIFPIVPLTLSLLAWAQPAPQGPQGQDDPVDAADHGVARVSMAEGNVSVTRGDSRDATGSALNAPLVTTDHVLTGEGSRAEIEFDSSNLMRLGPGAEVRMGDLAYHRYLVEIRQGTTTFRVLRDTDAKVEITTPSVSVAPLRQG